MNHVTQTTFGEGKGNCFPAAVASVLELALEEVPNVCVESPTRWFSEFNEWLGRLGLFALYFPVGEAESETIIRDREWPNGPPGPCILSGPNPDGVDHSTAWFNGDWWDPNPRRRYLTKVTSVIVFCSLNPAVDVRARLARRSL